MDWRKRYADKLLPAEEAVKAVNSGDTLTLGMFASTPETLATALFAAAAASSEGGRSIIAVPSNSTVDGERHSRIVPVFPEGTMTTVPRTFVDYVVTEYGIATLRGKTVRQRAEELISVAHPDFRAELRADAAGRYHV